jgi:hypothetical protein
MPATVGVGLGGAPVDTRVDPSTRCRATKADLMGAREPVGSARFDRDDGLDDAGFLAAVARGAEPSGHLGNLRLAWLLVRRDPDLAEHELAVALRRRAACTGGSVHQTRTVGWLTLVRVATAAAPDAATFDDLLARRPELLERRLLERHYSPELLAEPRAAAVVVPADRWPLPSPSPSLVLAS